MENNSSEDCCCVYLHCVASRLVPRSWAKRDLARALRLPLKSRAKHNSSKAEIPSIVKLKIRSNLHCLSLIFLTRKSYVPASTENELLGQLWFNLIVSCLPHGSIFSVLQLYLTTVVQYIATHTCTGSIFRWFNI
jgi:hypothetical protein